MITKSKTAFARFIGSGAFALGLASFVALLVLSQYLISHRPAHQQIGREYAFNQHGYVVYLTYGEHLCVSSLPYISGCLFALGIAVSRKYRA